MPESKMDRFYREAREAWTNPCIDIGYIARHLQPERRGFLTEADGWDQKSGRPIGSMSSDEWGV